MLAQETQTQTLTKTKTAVKVALIAGGILLAAAAVGGVRMKEIFYSGGLNVYSDYYPAAGVIVKANRGLNELFGFSIYANQESVDIKSIKFYFVPQSGADGQQMVNTFKNIKLYQKKRSSGYGYGYQYYNSYSLQQVGATVSQLTVDVNRPTLAFAVINLSPAVRIDANGYSDNSFILASEIAANNSWTGSFSVQIDEGKDVVGAGVSSGRGVSGASVNVSQAKGNWLKVRGITPVTILSPNGGEKWEVGKTYEIKWNSGSYDRNAMVQLRLRDVRFEATTTAGEISFVNTNNTGSYMWTVPASIGHKSLTNTANSGNSVFKIGLYLLTGASDWTQKSDESDALFSVVPASVTLLGDANLNGKVDIGDSLFIAQYVASKRQLSATAMANADVDGDGVVTKADADMIAQYLVGKIKSFPAGAAVSVGVSALPVAQNVIRGITGFTFANFTVSAVNAAHDIKIISIQVRQTVGGASQATDVTNMQLYDGANVLNTGSNALQPSGAKTVNDYVINLDQPLIVAKGAIKTLALKGNVFGNAAVGGFQQWGLSEGAMVSAVDIASGSNVTAVVSKNDGQKMTIIGGGSYSVSLDSSTPASRLVAGGTTGNVMTVLKFRATGEPINITKVQLGLTNPNSSANDLARVYLYDGAILLGRGILGLGNAQGGTNNAMSTFVLEAPLQIQANVEKILTIKADISPITTMNTVATAGHALTIDYMSSEAVGVSSGVKITDAKKTAGVSPAYIFRSVPTVSLVDLPSLTLGNGTRVISKFKVTADQKGDIDLRSLVFKVVANNATVANPVLVDVTNANLVLIAATSTIKNSSGNFNMIFTPRTISAGTSRTFELRATISGVASGSFVSVNLLGDSKQAPLNSYGLVLGNMIWSDMSNINHPNSADWTNGYLVSGLPSSGLSQTLSK